MNGNIGEKKHSELIKSRNEVTDLAGEFIQTDRDFTRKLLYRKTLHDLKCDTKWYHCSFYVLFYIVMLEKGSFNNM